MAKLAKAVFYMPFFARLIFRHQKRDKQVKPGEHNFERTLEKLCHSRFIVWPARSIALTQEPLKFRPFPFWELLALFNCSSNSVSIKLLTNWISNLEHSAVLALETRLNKCSKNSLARCCISGKLSAFSGTKSGTFCFASCANLFSSEIGRSSMTP